MRDSQKKALKKYHGKFDRVLVYLPAGACDLIKREGARPSELMYCLVRDWIVSRGLKFPPDPRPGYNPLKGIRAAAAAAAAVDLVEVPQPVPVDVAAVPVSPGGGDLSSVDISGAVDTGGSSSGGEDPGDDSGGGLSLGGVSLLDFL